MQLHVRFWNKHLHPNFLFVSRSSRMLNYVFYLKNRNHIYAYIHSRVKSISTLRYFPIYFILNHLFSTHSPEVIPCLIFIKFSALNPKINIKFYLYFSLWHDLNTKLDFFHQILLYDHRKLWPREFMFMFKS